jgi:hypothetical protein
VVSTANANRFKSKKPASAANAVPKAMQAKANGKVRRRAAWIHSNGAATLREIAEIY